MKALGIRCTKDQVQWAVVEGDTRPQAQVIERRSAATPGGDRADQLAWLRLEILEIINAYRCDIACVRIAEIGGQVQAATLGRAEMDGVVQATLSESRIAVRRIYSPTLRAAFSVKTKEALEQAIATLPCITAVPKTHRDPVVTALCALEK